MIHLRDASGLVWKFERREYKTASLGTGLPPLGLPPVRHSRTYKDDFPPAPAAPLFLPRRVSTGGPFA